jgi:hypothetical protein
LTCSSVPLVRLKLSAAPASRAHLAPTAQSDSPAKTAPQAKAPVPQDPLDVTLTFTRSSCPCHHSAHAKPPVDPLDHLDPPDPMAVPETQAATAATETTAHLVQLDPPDHPEPPVVPDKRAPTESLAPSRPALAHHQAHQDSPVAQVPLAQLVSPALLARMATMVPPASPASPASAVHQEATDSPALQVPQESQELPAAATTAHLLVLPPDIKLPTISANFHLAGLLLLLSTSRNSFRWNF